ncbi:hypothetical protein ABZ319_07720 [Nocardia sp. NPDC005978]|uniref:hypothetical protein n=1 Tax=Nocardia sp. NPDC005978 TaxID=3156725 RepID=UPI0033B6DC4C
MSGGSMSDREMRAATDRIAYEAFCAVVVAALGGRESKASVVMLARLDGVPFWSIAVQAAVSESRARHIFRDAVDTLRSRPDVVEKLRQFRNLDFGRIASDAEDNPLAFIYFAEGEWCGRHGRLGGDPDWFRQCESCVCVLDVMVRSTGEQDRGRGRPRRFCSDACRQAAQRERAKAKRAGTGASGDVPTGGVAAAGVRG